MNNYVIDFSNHWMKTLCIVNATQSIIQWDVRQKNESYLYLSEFIIFSFNFFQSPTSNCFTFSFFSFLFSSQWLNLRLTFSWAAPHVSTAIAIQCDQYCMHLFHQCTTVQIFTKIGTSRPAISFCEKVLDYWILTEKLAKASNIYSWIVLLPKDHKLAT